MQSLSFSFLEVPFLPLVDTRPHWPADVLRASPHLKGDMGDSHAWWAKRHAEIDDFAGDFVVDEPVDKDVLDRSRSEARFAIEIDEHFVLTKRRNTCSDILFDESTETGVAVSRRFSDAVWLASLRHSGFAKDNDLTSARFPVQVSNRLDPILDKLAGLLRHGDGGLNALATIVSENNDMLDVFVLGGVCEGCLSAVIPYFIVTGNGVVGKERAFWCVEDLAGGEAVV